jgi:hypothetical protein
MGRQDGQCVIRDVASWTTQDTPLRASGSQPPDLRWQLMNVWFCLAGGQPTGDPTSVSTTMPTAIGRLPSGPREVARTAAAWAADRRVGYRSVPFTRRPGYCTVTMKTHHWLPSVASSCTSYEGADRFTAGSRRSHDGKNRRWIPPTGWISSCDDAHRRSGPGEDIVQGRRAANRP